MSALVIERDVSEFVLLAPTHLKSILASQSFRRPLRDDGSALGRQRLQPKSNVDSKTSPSSRKLIIVTVLMEPYVMLRHDSAFYVGNERFEGFIVDMIEALSMNLDFDYELRLSEDGTLGTADRMGNWTGLVGELQRGDADMAAAPLAVSQDLQNVVDFTIPFLTFKSTALLRKPTGSGYNGRRISTPEDLLTSDLSYGIVEGSVSQRDLQLSPNYIYQSLWSRITGFWPPTIANSVEEGVQKVRSDRKGFAFIIDVPTAEYVISRQPCDVYATEPFLDSHSYAFALRRGDSQFREQVNDELKRFHDTDILQNLYLRWWINQCPLYRPSTVVASSRDPRHEINGPPSKTGRRNQRSSTTAIPSTQNSIQAKAMVSSAESSRFLTFSLVLLNVALISSNVVTYLFL